MVIRCYLCKRKYEKLSTRSYHRFPDDIKTRNEWFQIIGMKQTKSRFTYLCSDHFFPSDMFIRRNGTKMLKKDATPFKISLASAHTMYSTTGFDYSSSSSSFSSSSVSTDGTEISSSTSESETLEYQKNVTSLLRETKNLKINKSEKNFEISLQLMVPRENIAKRQKPRMANLNKHQLSKTKRNSQITKLIKQKQNKNIKTKVICMKSLLKHLVTTNMISELNKSTLDASLFSSYCKLIKQLLQGPNYQKYTTDLKPFALTLNFYSTQAYNYLRLKFNKSLPHTRIINQWYTSLNGDPGFNQESLNLIKIKVTKAKGLKVYCNLLMDQMLLKKQIDWTGKKFSGYVDFGGNLNSDSLPQAKEVLVFMLAIINSDWKIPIGYFFIRNLTSFEKANLVYKCLEVIQDTGIILTSFTFDGNITNLSMASILGGNFNADNLQPYFHHPITKSKIYFFLIPSI